MTNTSKQSTQSSGELAARCHEIQVCLGQHEVSDFETITEVGMAVRLALHLRGQAIIPYEHVRLVAIHLLGIPALAVSRILHLLADVEFVFLSTQGKTIRSVLSKVPYYEDLYTQLGDYALGGSMNEAEQLTIEIVRRLARSPNNVESLRNTVGAESKLFDRALRIGEEGSFLIKRRARGRDILISPTYFSENADVFADEVAAKGAKTVGRALEAVRSLQGVPLSLVEKAGRIGAFELSPAEIGVLRRMAQDGMVKPPSIQTTHAGENHFLFTPTPTGAALSPTKRDIYERAMAVVAAVRQGQLLSHKYAIRSPGAVIWTLRERGRLGRATTEATEQYRKLVHLRIGRLVSAGSGFSEFHIIQTDENKEALTIAYDLVSGGSARGVEVDEEARKALQQDQTYIESLVAAAELRKREVISLDTEQAEQLDLLLAGGAF
ncbi:MAG TPA: hypothetical protein VGC13_08695 [Longimicrobium sp.]|jgi:hypothetical protein|uniref:hypothetical protein n=1 Tax=Longimicrobium sp. TaxID=2029185 RepID=UPI002EDBA815